MNKIYTIGLMAMFTMALFSFSLVLAEETVTDVSEVSLISANTDDSFDEPVSRFRYGWERFKLGFVRNQTIKAERELQLARWKLAEANFAIKNGNVERAEKAMEAHEAVLGRVQERISKMENKSITPGLDNALRVHESKMDRLGQVLQNANLTEAQRERVQERISKMDEGNQKLEEVRAKVQERVQRRVEGLENKTENIEARGDQVQERIQERVEETGSDGSGKSN